MTFRVGLTGSIGMGKSTTARMFAEHPDVALWDADAAVHRLYAKGGDAVAPIAALCPEAIVEGAVDRSKLKEWISSDQSALKQIETIVHPLVSADRAKTMVECSSDILVCDIPLLFETGVETTMDLTVVVSTDTARQKARVMERGTMSESQFVQILAKQMPDAEKRARADVVIDTSNLGTARVGVEQVLKNIRSGFYA